MFDLIARAQALGASDLHLVAGAAPLARVDGEIVLLDHPPLADDAIAEMMIPLLTDAQRHELDDTWQLCFSRTIPTVGYVRVTLYYRQRRLEAAIRLGREVLPDRRALGLPPVLDELIRRPSGLFLITGPTGSGKTTTMNALIDLVNAEQRAKIVMIEDPIEYVHANRRSVVVQQEVGTDVKSFARAVVHVLRQDPDVIAIGELRDLETISAALTAAETGHLVLATLHSNDCPSTINRVVDVFPEAQQQQVRFQLSMSLRAVMNQRLLARADGRGRLLVYGLLVGTPAVASMIRDNKLAQLLSVMQSSRKDGMVVMDDLIRDAYLRAEVGYDEALSNMSDPRGLVARVTGAKLP
jgi:twitching motility protein PilT